jgi:tRNA(Ile)-lysidine synthase TilS/MesJ
MGYTREQIEKAVKVKNYKWFEDASNKTYDVNIVGVRNNDPKIADKVTNIFDDYITISFKNEKGVWQFYSWMATTDPGKKGAQQFHNKKGVARLVPGQYRGVWSIDKHQGKYEALCQRNGNVTVYRDANKDLVFEEKVTDTGMFGINIHKAGQDSTWVDGWSEGCSVFKRVREFEQFMTICRRAAKIHGNKFSYTLIESTDII